jgi:hypothetical protein
MRRLLFLPTVIGMLLLALGGYSYWRELEFLRRAETAAATVTKYSVSRSSGDEAHCPIFVFTRGDGMTVVYYGEVCASPPAYEIGQQVEVLYDPLEDGDVQLNDFWSKYEEPLKLFGAGLPVFLIGLFGLSQRGRKAKEK